MGITSQFQHLLVIAGHVSVNILRKMIFFYLFYIYIYIYICMYVYVANFFGFYDFGGHVWSHGPWNAPKP
jgi:hypothetical protein